MCACGHSLEEHGDRSIWPACEGNAPWPRKPILRHINEETGFLTLADVYDMRIQADACECRGFG